MGQKYQRRQIIASHILSVGLYSPSSKTQGGSGLTGVTSCNVALRRLTSHNRLTSVLSDVLWFWFWVASGLLTQEDLRQQFRRMSPLFCVRREQMTFNQALHLHSVKSVLYLFLFCADEQHLHCFGMFIQTSCSSAPSQRLTPFLLDDKAWLSCAIIPSRRPNQAVTSREERRGMWKWMWKEAAFNVISGAIIY